jgi:predicted phosphodiesterase
LRQAGVGNTRLILVSDTHLAERAVELNANWEVIHRWIRREAADKVVHLGDISAAGDRQNSDLRVAADILKSIELHPLPGNHDIGDNPGPGAYGPDDAQHGNIITDSHLQAYRALFGQDYWSIALPGWQIIGLNAQLLGSGLAAEEVQREWLLHELAKGTGRVGVMIHKPLYRNGASDTEVHERYLPIAPRQRLLSDIRHRDVAFIVSGHTHQTRRYVSEGIEHVWAPSTAFYLPDSLQEAIGDKVVGALILDLQPSGCRFRLTVPDGLRQYNLLDHEHVYPELAQFKRRLSAGG